MEIYCVFEATGIEESTRGELVYTTEATTEDEAYEAFSYSAPERTPAGSVWHVHCIPHNLSPGDLSPADLSEYLEDKRAVVIHQC